MTNVFNQSERLISDERCPVCGSAITGRAETCHSCHFNFSEFLNDPCFPDETEEVQESRRSWVKEYKDFAFKFIESQDHILSQLSILFCLGFISWVVWLFFAIKVRWSVVEERAFLIIESVVSFGFIYFVFLLVRLFFIRVEKDGVHLIYDSSIKEDVLGKVEENAMKNVSIKGNRGVIIVGGNNNNIEFSIESEKKKIWAEDFSRLISFCRERGSEAELNLAQEIANESLAQEPDRSRVYDMWEKLKMCLDGISSVGTIAKTVKEVLGF